MFSFLDSFQKYTENIDMRATMLQGIPIIINVIISSTKMDLFNITTLKNIYKSKRKYKLDELMKSKRSLTKFY